ncbi:UDP-glucose 4-epimerase GalE [Xanthovirga aplysinae]|uniref:UDP-glucose 4-epimerase GalE n=1 Tax=Xanthovirga aplysinae TaxID=2529853 RepID=UPI0012BC64B1|nr:UDP-glucose 4-epimerase GalE [Xanthovirga aplysinae]MTI31042.1 UDP-glucose 4-epimerase GalE [Xanthovirga aplysinae]
MSKSKKILVTGGAGFIGSHTVVELNQAGYEAVIIDNFSNSEKGVIEQIEKITGIAPKIYEGDCNDIQLMQNIFDQEGLFAGVIHFAAYKAVGESVEKPLDYYHNNLNSLLILLRTMENFKVSNLVFSSSCTVYGEPDLLPVTEESPKKQAESPYGNTKAISEEILEDTVKGKNSNLKAVALRYFNPIGAHPSSLIGELPLGVPNNLVPFITQTAAGLRERLTVFGDDYNTPDGTCIRDYIHVVDLAKAHVKAFEYLENQGNDSFFDLFNVGTGKGNSVLEAIKTFEQVNGLKLNYTIGQRRSGDVEKVFAKVDKSEKLLNWKAELSLDQALKDAWGWQKKLSNIK